VAAWRSVHRRPAAGAARAEFDLQCRHDHFVDSEGGSGRDDYAERHGENFSKSIGVEVKNPGWGAKNIETDALSIGADVKSTEAGTKSIRTSTQTIDPDVKSIEAGAKRCGFDTPGAKLKIYNELTTPRNLIESREPVDKC